VDEISLAIEAFDEHRTSVHLAAWLVGSKNRVFSAFGCDVPHALAKATSTELLCAAEEFDGIVSVIGGYACLHSAEVFVTERQDVRAHLGRV